MHDYLAQMLACPSCRGDLAWTIDERHQDRIETAEARCTACDVTYPVHEGVGLFLTPDLPRDDLWELADSQLLRHLRDHPEIERRLLDVSLDALAPADQFFRAMVLEERGEYAEAKAAEELADEGLYTPEVRACRDSQTEYVLESLSAGDGPVVDLASGRCYLVEKMARTLQRPIVATDFSPRVLRRDRRWLEFLGLYDQVSLLAFDARRAPFKDGAIETLTTNQGLPNIKEPDELLRELRRIVAGTFLAIHHFYPEDDEANAAALRAVGLATLLFRRLALARFIEAGWQVEAANVRVGRALSTPAGVVLDGAGIDRFPVAETVLEWCVLVAR
jgi:uncharacterized protein YbaR (Trm112 family)